MPKPLKKPKTPSSVRGTFDGAPINLASLVRGLYGRVAQQVGVDPSYVSRVARDERRSQTISNALQKELNRIGRLISKQRGKRMALKSKRGPDSKYLLNY